MFEVFSFHVFETKNEMLYLKENISNMVEVHKLKN